MPPLTIPTFRSHWAISGGHRQTLAGAFFPGRLPDERGAIHTVHLPDGDSLCVHDDQPAAWRAGDPATLLLHGLAGSHRSSYLVRAAALFNESYIRTFRLNLRGCGTGAGAALKPYNAGCSDDVAAVIRRVIELCPQSPITLIGFSLGGNIALKFLGEFPHRVPSEVIRAAAVNPPIDLARCTYGLSRWPHRHYDAYFVKKLLQRLRELQQQRPDFLPPTFLRTPRRLVEFDDQFTAPRSGYRNADDYYERCSSEQFIPTIRIPTLILTARNDPLIPVASFERLSPPANVRLHIAEGGGHLGYLAATNDTPSRFWLQRRLLDWMFSS
jgi:predicted alpha/beta-fold hydrolase